MKKTVLILLMFVALSAAAQVRDTIYNRIPHCWYPSWYDECKAFEVPHEIGDGRLLDNFSLYELCSGFPDLYATSSFTDAPIAVNGIAVMVIHEVSFFYRSVDTLREPEYVMLYQGLGDGEMELLDSVRWDTLTPSVLKLPLMADTAQFGFVYCDVYQVRFNSPIVVDSTFYMGGTLWTNRPYGIDYLHTPLAYAYMSYAYSPKKCFNDVVMYTCDPEVVYRWYRYSDVMTYYGPFIAMVDFAMLEVESGDISMGSVVPGGSYSINTDQTIEAVPYLGCTFSHWNDGDTTNPRVIHFTQDTLFTAYFAEDTTEGGGDTTGIAAADAAASFSLMPNPSDGKVTVRLPDGVRLPATLSVSDASGREVLRREISDTQHPSLGLTLRAGLYFVTLSTPQGSSTQKLVVQ